jgi:hypothetical protein
VIDTIPASKRRGLNRATWSMRERPPRVPRAATLAFSASQGPRVLPGTYTARLTRGTEVIETRLEVTLDRRAPFTLADRKAQHAAAMRVHALFGRMSALVDRIQVLRGAAGDRARAVRAEDPALAGRLEGLDRQAEKLRKEIVATKEGGAITGEERIREHAEILYGALNQWEGRPARYQVERIGALERELSDVAGALDALVDREVPPLDAALRARGLAPLPTDAPPAPGTEVSSADLGAGLAAFAGERVVVRASGPAERD